MTATGAKERPLPITKNPFFKTYFDYAKRHEFRLQQCKSCRTYNQFPAATCSKCSGTDLEWALLSGKATVDSYIVIGTRGAAQAAPASSTGLSEPFVVAQVCPDEAPLVRVMCNVLDCPTEAVHIGMPLEVTFMDLTEEYTIPQFRPMSKVKG